MILEATAPTRIDLAGGTLDIYPISLLEGEVVTVNLAVTIPTRVRMERYGGGVAVSSQDLGVGVEAPDAASLPIGGPLDLVLRAVRYAEVPARTRVVTASEAPRGSGLGASSSLLVATLAACDRWKGGRRTWKASGDLVEVAARLEAQSIAAPTGKQDYYAALHGGLNAVWFHLDGEAVEQLLPPRRLGGLEEHLVLTFTGEPHASGLTNWSMVRAYLDGVPETVRGLRAIGRISRQMREALRGGDLRLTARLLREEWEQRRTLAAGVSTPEIERAVRTARRAGALASKVCGAGGGGCVVSLVRTGKKDAVTQALAAEGFRLLPVRIARTGLRVRARASRGRRSRRPPA